jgi:hypothetical protein
MRVARPMEMLTLEDEEAVYLRSRVWDLDPGRWYPMYPIGELCEELCHDGTRY